MRFFLLLAAVVALFSIARAKSTSFQLPGPFVDGTIITFFFWHKDNSEKTDHKVVIDFYNHPTNYAWKKGGVYDIPAKISIMSHVTRPVETNTYQYGLWWKDNGDRMHQRLNTMPVSTGWWRIDLLKIDSRRMHIFFQGFWSGIREFGMSIDGIQSAYIDGTYMDTRFVEFIVKTADPKPFRALERFNAAGGYDASSKPLAKINTFPIGSRIELITMLMASGDRNSKLPSLNFGPKPVKEFETIFFAISQSWDDQNTHTLLFGFGNFATQCINTKPNGDLHHLQLERISKDVIRMRVMYHPTATNMDKVTCDLTIPPNLWSHMDRPFYILGDQGAIIFHIEQSIPQALSLLPTL